MIMSLRKTIALLLFFLVFGVNSVVADKTVDPIIVGVVHSEAYPSAAMMKRSFKMAVEAKNSKGGITFFLQTAVHRRTAQAQS